MKILVLPGDGIGPEITDAALDVLSAADRLLCLGLEFERREIGLKSLAEQGCTLPAEVMARIPQVDGVLLGPVSHYDYPSRAEGGINPSAELRTVFELFANVRPCRAICRTFRRQRYLSHPRAKSPSVRGTKPSP